MPPTHYLILPSNREVLKSDGGAVLAKIVNQMDTISTKVGEEPGIDKMVNLLSVLKVQDRKYTAGEMLEEVG